MPNEIFLTGDLTRALYPDTSTLIVHVRRNADRDRVDGMPVNFQLGPKCQGVGKLSTPRAVTRHGSASITFTGNDTIACHIAIEVDNMTQKIWVDISVPPDVTTGK